MIEGGEELHQVEIPASEGETPPDQVSPPPVQSVTSTEVDTEKAHVVDPPSFER